MTLSDTMSKLGKSIINLMNTRADRDLSNLTSTGESRLVSASGGLTQNQITNCLLEVPQRIKYTLVDGTLTIKAGSVVIVPYGTEDLTDTYPKGATFLNDNFKVYDTQFTEDATNGNKFFVWAEVVDDITSGEYGYNDLTGEIFVQIPNNEMHFTALNQLYSGASGTLSSGNVWYDTTNNFVYRESGNQWVGTWSLPTMITKSNGTTSSGVANVSSVSQVFNGMGYIGSTVWVDKGVRGLYCNGKNDDETIRNTYHTTSKLIIISVPTVTLPNLGVVTDIYDNIAVGLYRSSRTEFGRQNFFTFNIVRNYIYTEDNIECPRLLNAYIDVVDGKISKFSPAILVQCADAQSFLNRNGDSMVGCLTLGGLNISDSADALKVCQGNAKKLGVTSYSNIYFANADGEEIAILGGVEYTDNGTGLRFLVKNRSTNQWDQLFNLVSSAGSSAIYTVNSSAIGSILSTAGISKSGAGYVLFGNGIIIQWGTTGVSTSGTIYYPVSLPMQPRVVITPYGGNVGWSKSCINFSNDGSHFNFTRVDACEHMWIAIGWLF